MKLYITLISILSLSSCSQLKPQRSVANTDPFEILRLRIMERMAGNESSN